MKISHVGNSLLGEQDILEIRLPRVFVHLNVIPPSPSKLSWLYSPIFLAGRDRKCEWKPAGCRAIIPLKVVFFFFKVHLDCWFLTKRFAVVNPMPPIIERLNVSFCPYLLTLQCSTASCQALVKRTEAVCFRWPSVSSRPWGWRLIQVMGDSGE